MRGRTWGALEAGFAAHGHGVDAAQVVSGGDVVEPGPVAALGLVVAVVVERGVDEAHRRAASFQ